MARHTSTSPQVEEDSSEISQSCQGSAQDDTDTGDDSDAQSRASAESEEEEQVLQTHAKKRKFSEDEITATVLSRAEKRHQKRRERQRQEQDDNNVLSSKKVPPGESKKPSRSDKRQNSVWVGNLAFKTTVDDLKSFFSDAGEITRVNMPTKAAPPSSARKPENRGFAYVDFSTSEAKVAAIALSEQPLTGRKLLIKDGDDFTGRPKLAESDKNGVEMPRKTSTLSKTAQRILKSQKQPPGPTLFLGNLGFETTEANIMEMLNAHHRHSSSIRKKDDAESSKSALSDGWIRKVRMGTFEDSGLCKGFAFVDFVCTESATSALVNPKNFSLNGRKLVIEYASPDAVRRGMPKPKQQQRQKWANNVDGDGDKSQEWRVVAVAPEDDNDVEKPKQRQRQKRANNVDDDGDKSWERREVGAAPEDDNDVEKNSEEQHRLPKRRRVEKAPNPKRRARPGAALASAQRQSVAIIPSQGKKIKFD